MFRGVDRDLETLNQSGWRIQIDHVKISQPTITTPTTVLRAIVVDGLQIPPPPHPGTP